MGKFSQSQNIFTEAKGIHKTPGNEENKLCFSAPLTMLGCQEFSKVTQINQRFGIRIKDGGKSFASLRAKQN